MSKRTPRFIQGTIKTTNTVPPSPYSTYPKRDSPLLDREPGCLSLLTFPHLSEHRHADINGLAKLDIEIRLKPDRDTMLLESFD